ncbi:MAG: hypothetical protein CMP10_02775 [Zetaproteobacteria bacterium]|nr:hypothetical protein [Pseudobdellovibrionaceae bacterium]
MSYRTVFLIVWCLTFLLVAAGLYQDLKIDKNVDKEQSLAQMVSGLEEVKFRRDGNLLWLNPDMKQVFFNGDSIATGKGAFVVMDLGMSRIVEMGEKSLIMIKSTNQSGEVDREIHLIKGILKYKSQNNVGLGIDLYDGSDQIYRFLPGAEQVVITKSLGESKSRILEAKGDVISLDKPRNKSTSSENDDIFLEHSKSINKIRPVNKRGGIESPEYLK